MPEDAFSRLEQTVEQAAELIKGLRAENASLKEEMLELRREFEALRTEQQRTSQRNETLEKERLKVRTRVERILGALAALEEPPKGSSSRVRE